MKNLLLFFFVFIAFFKLNAQSQCGTDELDAYLKRTNPQYDAEREKMEQDIYTILKNKQNNPNARIAQNDCQPNGVFTIPVVVHVIHLGEPVGTGTNISQATINNAITNLNKYWRRILGDGVDLEIQFALAVRDPNGNTTTGINRVDGSSVPNYIADGIANGPPPGANSITIKSLSYWPRDKYINIWVCNKIAGGTIAGYANLPTPPPFDEYEGIVINSTSIQGQTFTHEMGHFFDLYHTFEGSSTNCPLNNDCLVQGDKVCDTPPHKQDECISAICSSSGIFLNDKNNFMSYCSIGSRFTQGQKDRVRAALYHRYRWCLILSDGLIPINTNLEAGITLLNNVSEPLCRNTKPVVKIKNSGLTKIDSIRLVVQLDNLTQLSNSYNISLLKDSSINIEIQNLVLNITGRHVINIKIEKINNTANDYNTVNNSICSSVLIRDTSQSSFCVNFENGNEIMYGLDTIIAPYITSISNCNSINKCLKYDVFNKSLSRYEENGIYLPPFNLDSLNSAYIVFDYSFQSPEVNNRIYFNMDILDGCEDKYDNNMTFSNTTSNIDSITPWVPSLCSDWRKDSISIGYLSGHSNLMLKIYLDYFTQKLQNIYFDNFCIHKRYKIYATVNPSGNGYITYSVGNAVYDEGGTATITANPYYCKSFKNWTENGIVVSTNASYTFIVTKNRNLVANFDIKKVNITSSAFPSYAGITLGDGQYLCDSTYALKARANMGYKFNRWTDSAGTSIYSYDTILRWSSNIDKKFVARFNILINGSASNSNSGIVYGTGYYAYNDSATVSAYPQSCYVFTNWTVNGIVVSTNPIYKFKVTQYTNIVANFTRPSYNILLVADPSNTGTLTGNGTFACDTSVKITAHAKYGYNFYYWSDSVGNLISYDSIYTLYVYKNEILTAHFEPKSFLINYTYSANGNSSSTNQYYNSTYTVNADTSISTCFTFKNWTKNGTVVSTNPIYTFVVDGNMNLVANYEKRKYNISLISNFSNAGTLTGGGTFQPNNCDTVITIKAQDNSCYVFKNWSENGVIFSYAPTYTINLKYYYPNNRTLTAIFEPKRYNITLAASPTNGGTVAGAGNFACDSSLTVKAKIKTGYKFTNWTEGTTIVSTDSNYTFQISGARSLKANFSLLTGIKQTTINEISKIYPNPANEILQIEIHSKQNTSFTLNIIDMKGSLLETKKINNTKGTFNTSFDVSKLAKGNYLLNLYDEDGMASYKFVVQ